MSFIFLRFCSLLLLSIVASHTHASLTRTIRSATQRTAAVADTSKSWVDMAEGPEIAAITSFLGNKDQAAVAATSHHSRRLAYGARGVLVPPDRALKPKRTAETSFRYGDTELRGKAMIFDTHVKPADGAADIQEMALGHFSNVNKDASRRTTNTALQFARTYEFDPSSMDTSAFILHARNAPAHTHYQGTLMKRAAPTASIAGDASGGPASAATASGGPARAPQRWVPQGSGKLIHHGEGKQTLRKDEVLEGFFSTDKDGFLTLEGNYSLSNGTTYQGTVKLIDGKWRRIGKGTEISAQGHHLEGTFVYRDNRTSATEATLTLPSGASQHGTAMQFGDIWGILTDGSEVRPNPPELLEQPSIYVNDLYFIHGNRFQLDNAYYLPGGGYYLGRIANTERSPIMVGHGVHISPEGIWHEANHRTNGTLIPYSTTIHYMDGSTAAGGILKNETGALYSIGQVQRTFKNGAVLLGTPFETPRSLPGADLRRGISYHGADGTSYKGDQLQEAFDQWWPHGEGELKLPDNTTIVGTFGWRPLREGESGGGGFQPSTVRAPTPYRMNVQEATVVYPTGRVWRGNLENTSRGWQPVEAAPLMSLFSSTRFNRMLGGQRW